MRRKIFTGLLCTLGLVTAAPNAAAQAWDAPSLLPPREIGELGAALIMPEHANWGLIGYWRQPGSLNLGVRGGLVDYDGTTAFLVGSEFWGLLLRQGASSPVNLAWTLGLGGTFFDDVTTVRVPVGVSAGIPLELSPGVVVHPYAHPRFGVDVLLIDDESETDTSIFLDIGADVAIGDNLILKVGGTLVDHSAWGIGLSWVSQRGVSVQGR